MSVPDGKSFDPKQAIEVNPDAPLFQVTLTRSGAVTWTCPQGTDDVYFRGMMDKLRETILAQMAVNAMGQRRAN